MMESGINLLYDYDRETKPTSGQHRKNIGSVLETDDHIRVRLSNRLAKDTKPRYVSAQSSDHRR